MFLKDITDECINGALTQIQSTYVSTSENALQDTNTQQRLQP